LNKNIEGILNAVADNDLQKAKQYVKIIVDEDETQANRWLCQSIKRKLQASSLNFIELPQDVKSIIHMEDVSISFNENRYYLSERENKVLEEVIGMYQTSLKLSEMGIQYLNSLMLYGESGTGKTLFGKYVAYKLGLPFVYMNFSNAISSYLGSTGQNISKAFAFIEKQKCVFMVDEIDAIGLKRGTKDIGEMSRVVISLMQALDLIRNDTIIIGATNRFDMIDSALSRRFTMKHEVKRFSENELAGMATKFLDDVNIPYSLQKVTEFCKDKICQYNVINELIRAIAYSIRTGNSFELQ
jgi:SpoVK/Ycf46/Vps4 family AAA+-type ATPase